MDRSPGKHAAEAGGDDAREETMDDPKIHEPVSANHCRRECNESLCFDLSSQRSFASPGVVFAGRVVLLLEFVAIQVAGCDVWGENA